MLFWGICRVFDTVPIRVHERKRRKGNKLMHADDETSSISYLGIPRQVTRIRERIEARSSKLAEGGGKVI